MSNLDKLYVQKVLNYGVDLALLDKICVYVNKTYDFYNIEKYFPDIIELFYLGVDEYEKEPAKYPNCNKTFMRLLNNSANINELIKVDYISGPAMLYKLEKDNTIIYLIGEQPHSNIKNCTTVKSISDEIKNGSSHIKIHDYLKNLFNNTSVFIDFYVELPVLMKSIVPQENITLFSDIAPEFIDCLGSNKQNCKYNNVRIHSIDSRRLDDVDNRHKYDSLTKFMKYIHYITNLINTNQTINVLFNEFIRVNKKIINAFSKKTYS